MSVTKLQLDSDTRTVRVITPCGILNLNDGDGSYESHGIEIHFDAANRTVSINDECVFLRDKDGDVLILRVSPPVREDELDLASILADMRTRGGRIVGFGLGALDDLRLNLDDVFGEDRGDRRR